MTRSRDLPTGFGRGRTTAALACIALVATGSGALLAAPWGVPLTGGSRKAAISTPTDTDSYAIEAEQGNRLVVSVKVPRSSDLVPELTLLGPEGPIEDATFTQKGRNWKLDRLDAPLPGLYELVVAGAAGSQGEYAAKASVRGAGKRSVRGLSAGAGDVLRIPFAAAGSARVDFKATTSTQALQFVRVEDPQGLPVPVSSESIRTAGRAVSGKKILLPDGVAFGRWVLVLRAPSSAVDGVKVRITRRGPKSKRPKGRLPEAEPRIDSVTPTEAGPGSRIEVRGSGFVGDDDGAVSLFVGGRRVQDAQLSGAGLVAGSAPQGLSGTADVALLTGDGHAAHLVDAIEIVLPPTLVSLSVERGPARGGTMLEIRGAGFRPGAAVTIAGVPFGGSTNVVDGELIVFTTPAFAAGSQTVAVKDPTGQSSREPAEFEFVAGPVIASVHPPLVAAIEGEQAVVRGSALDTTLAVSGTILVGGLPPDAATSPSSDRLELTLPELPLGPHALVLDDEFGQRTTRLAAVTAFEFRTGAGFDDVDTAGVRDLTLADYDLDGDLDVFLVCEGGATLATESRLRALRNDGADGFVDVTDDVIPETNADDDWRGVCIATGHLAGELGESTPDAYPDLVIGTTDADVLPASRSRLRILANRARPGGGGRRFADLTTSLMAARTNDDVWKTEDLWIGDLDGDGGVDDIVAVHDDPVSGELPFAPYQVNYESGTRVFSLGGQPARFAWQMARFPRFVGARQAGAGLPVCREDECADDYQPFRGVSLAVADLDGDGRRDVAVTTPELVTLFGNNGSSTQFARNVADLDGVRFEDATGRLPASTDLLEGDHVFFAHVVGDAAPDLLILSASAAPGESALLVAENRGFDRQWTPRQTTVLPGPDGAERLQADAAEVADVDGDGDLDVVLFRARPSASAPGDLVTGLRILRNQGDGLEWALDPVLPEADDAEQALGVAVGDLDGDGGLGIVLVGEPAGGSGTSVQTVRRETSE